jgi:membrane associated rhomboid family serine protease
MLVIPLTRKLTWQNPPVITISIILLNCFVYFFIQEGGVTSPAYGFTPASASFLTAFTYMFLHGNVPHLLGNMIFLWLVGCVLELGCGRGLYVLFYLTTGILSAAFYGLLNQASHAPLIGASGAIAGLMGIYCVMYGRRRIKVFYSLGFYFATVEVPAIIVLPFWIGNEAFQLLFSQGSNIAYEAHLGGLISGAFFGFLQARFLGASRQEFFDEDPEKETARLMEEGLKRLSDLDLENAHLLMEQVLERDPSRLDVLTHLFNIDKLQPDKENCHRSAEKLLTRLSQENDAHEETLRTYTQYVRIAGKCRLSEALRARLSVVFSESGHVDEAAGILVQLMKSNPSLPQIPTAILELARAFFKQGMPEKGVKCLKLICGKYPQALESQIAQKMLEEKVDGSS